MLHALIFVVIELVLLLVFILQALEGRKVIAGIALVILLVVFYQAAPGAWRAFRGENKEDSQEEILSTQVDELQAEVERLTNENEQLQTELDTRDSMDESSAISILNLVYAPNGKTYEPKEDFKFYSDINCQTEISDIKFLTNANLHEELDNGGMVYILLSDKGFVYSIREPQLQEITNNE